jgi:hypothetical protein
MEYVMLAMDTQVWWRILKRHLARPYTSLQFALEGLRRSEAIAHLYDLYRPEIAAAKSHQEREQALAGFYGDLEEPQDDLADWETRRWNKLATRYHVQTPELPTSTREDSEYWRFS